MATVNTCWGLKEIRDQVYWHLVPPSGFNVDMFKNNVRVGKGALLSISVGIAAEPHLENAQTLYSLSRIEDLEERLFEEVRRKISPTSLQESKLYMFLMNIAWRKEPKQNGFKTIPKKFMNAE
ncbi:MAG: hypothetical protein HY739_00370 [Desulfobacterales bacterium]|nr:hypothetical protein [Desulfobacterales bacterium]